MSNTHYIRSKSGQITYIDEKSVPGITKDLQAGKNIFYQGKYIANSSVSEFGEVRGSSEEVGISPLSLAAGEVFGEKHGEGFWEQVFRINMGRKAGGKSWIFENVIQEAKRKSGKVSPKDLFLWIDDNPEEEAKNKPDYSRLVRGIQVVNRGGSFCGKCENGWLSGRNGFYPCDCNESGKKAISEYREKMRY